MVKGKVEDNRAIVSLIGQVDTTNASQVEAEINATLQELQFSGLTIDASELRYISSAGLRVLLRLIQKYRDVKMVEASADVYDVMEMTGFADMMPVSKAMRTVDITGCEPIAKGANGIVYRLDPETIIKVYIKPDSLPDIQRERELARCAFVHGIPTAISYDVVKVEGSYGSVFEMLSANSISKWLKLAPEGIDDYVKCYVDILKQLHATHIEPGKMPDMKAVAVDWAEFVAPHLTAPLGDKLVALVKAVPVTDTIIHGDYHVRNVMIQNGEPILIDMDTLSLGHPIFELGSMYMAYRGFSILDHNVVQDFLGLSYDMAGEFWRKSLALYLEGRQSTVQEVEDKASVITFMRLIRRTLRRNGQETEEGRNFIAVCRERLEELLRRIDTLEFD